MQEVHNEPRIEESVYQEPVDNVQAEPKKNRRQSSVAWVVLGLIVAGLIFAVVALQASYKSSFRPVPELPPSRASLASVSAPSPVELSTSFREISKRVKPAVVYINIIERAGEGEREPEIFGFPAPPRPRRGAGSGFIVTEDGYILTNEHVVGSAGRIEVTLADGRKMNAEVIGADQGTDLAVIKIPATGLPIVVLGDSDSVQQGDWVLALGSPFGLQQTLTAGIVSATGREVGPQYSRFIQTDASINPGNSGGPLVDMNAEVIGINTMILTGSPSNQGNVGIGFAIASKVARDVFEKLVRTGKVTRGYLGVNMQELEGPIARSLNLEPNSGVLISQVNPQTPAEKAGLRSGDVITSFDDKRVKTIRELSNVVADTPVGKSVQVEFVRNGQPQSVIIQVAERPADVNAARPAEPDPERGGTRERRLGILGQTITPEMAGQMNLQTPTGVFVVSVQPGSPAAEATIRHGDVIHRIGRTEIISVDDLAQAVRDTSGGEEVAVQLERNGRMIFVTLTLG